MLTKHFPRMVVWESDNLMAQLLELRIISQLSTVNHKRISLPPCHFYQAGLLDCKRWGQQWHTVFSWFWRWTGFFLLMRNMAIRKFLFFTNKWAGYSREVGQASEGLWASKIDKDCTVAPPPQNTNGDISSGLGVTKNGQMWHACQRFSLCIKDPILVLCGSI